MSKLIDRTGKRFGRLTVLGLDDQRASDGQARWICLCDCGETTVVIGGNLSDGNVRSCGCLRRERSSRGNRTHGKHGSRVYRCWVSMLQRCRNRNLRDYESYGGRGIKVCKRWQKFENFYTDMGDPPPATSLDRIDVDGNYEPGNCRWATRKEQNNNQRSNHVVKYKGKEYTLAQLAERVDMKPDALRSRLESGWSVERAVETPAFQPKTYKYKGEEFTVAQLAEKVGIKRLTLYARLRRGWSLEDAVETPVQRT